MTFLDRASAYLADHTDAELVPVWESLRYDRLRPIPLATVNAYLLTEGLDEPLEAAVTDPAVPAPVQSGVRRFLKTLADPRLNNLDYQNPKIYADTQAVLGAMVQLGRMTADQADAIRAMGGGLAYTFAAEDGLGTDPAHFAAARVAKARRDAVAAAQPALDAWLAAEAKKVTDWAAGGFSGELAAMGSFAYPPTGGGQ